MGHHKHSWLLHLLLPGTILTDAHSDKKELKIASKEREKLQKEKDHHEEVLAEIAAGGMPDLAGSKGSKILGEGGVNGLFGTVASVFGGGQKKKQDQTPLLIGGGLLLLLVLFMSKKK